MKIMSTNCVIEQLQLEHFTDIHKLYSNKQVRTYLGGVPSNSYIEASFKGMLEAPFPNTYLCITLKETGEFIGLVSIDEYYDKELYELSYQFYLSFGEGLAFEVLTQVIEEGLNYLNIASVVAETQTANKASCRLLEKLGMKKVQMLERFGQEQAVYELRKIMNRQDKSLPYQATGFLSRTLHLSMSIFYDKLRKMNELKFVLLPPQVRMHKGISRSFMQHSTIVKQHIFC